MQYISHETHAVYSGDRTHWKDIPVVSEQPSECHVPVVENGEHVGWEIDEEKYASYLETERKLQESLGVTVNGVRYSGDSSNRQALNEALQYAAKNGLTVFPIWKDSDSLFHVTHPVNEVEEALNAIGTRRSYLIAKEGGYLANPVDADLINWS